MLPPKSTIPRNFRRLISFRTKVSSPLPPAKPPRLSLLADQCTSMDQLKQIHAQMITTGRIHDNYAASRIFSFAALSLAGDLTYALELFGSIRQPNTFMWNTLIRAQASGSKPQEALFLYVKMRRLCVVPGKHTFPFLLKACTTLKRFDVIQQVHTHVFKFGLDLDLHVVNGLIRAFSVSAALNNARKLFVEFPERNLTIWTTMVCGYAQNDSPDEAIKLFERMIADGVEPNAATLASVLSACAQASCLELGQQIHLYIEEKEIGIGVILGTALVNMYAKNGAILEATKCFNSMKEKNIATWNAIIGGLAAHGHAKEAIHLFNKLGELEGNVKPNEVTLLGVLSACCHAGFLDYGRQVFDSMKDLYGIEPKIEHYGCMVDLLGRCGKLLEAEQLIRGMVWKADVAIWGSLLRSCQSQGNIDIAERVVKEILVLDPNNHGVYVGLSNVYAELGRWEDVLQLRKEMKQGSLKKTPGWSYVNR
nr:pentatricopeptide repeat-containing protein At5g56310-like [Ipomoea batatas]